MSLDSQALTQFLAVYRHRSINRACREIGVSQPGLSKGLRRLEDMLGVALFERRAGGVAPTPYADALALRAQVVEAELKGASRDIEHMRNHILGEARIGVAPAIATRALPDVLSSLLAQHPDLTVTVVEGLFETLAARIAANELDFALTTLPSAGVAPGLQAETLQRDQFIVAAAGTHPLARMRAIGPADLLAYPWVLPPRDGLIWQRVVDLFAGHGLRPPEPQIETSSGACIKGMVQAGRFLTFVPRRLIAHEEERGEIVVLSAAGLAIERDIILLRRTNSILSPAAEAIVNAIRQSWGQIPRKTHSKPKGGNHHGR